jgi:hypothetical protein
MLFKANKITNVWQANTLTSPAVLNAPNTIERATPANSLDSYFNFLFRMSGELERPTSKAPQRPFTSNGLKS